MIITMFCARCMCHKVCETNGDHYRCNTCGSVVARDSSPSSDPVNHPPHYTSHPSGVECITVARHFSFNLGNVLKYIWRAPLKGATLEDLKKARWYLDDEIKQMEKK